jgi:ferredoxin
MASIRVQGREEVYPANLTTSILNILLQNGFPIQTFCGGRAQCGRDLIRVKSGGELLSPCREQESRRLAALAAEGEPSGPDMRLACQTYARGDVLIEVIHLEGTARGSTSRGSTPQDA